MSDLFKWSESEYGLKIKEMDDEHKKLISLMNTLHDLFQTNSSREKLEPVFQELAAYTVKHFADEEKYMESIGFEGVTKHKYIHKDLLEKLGRHKLEFEATGTLSDEFFKFLKFWLSAHIQGIDMKYSEFIHRKSA